MNEARLVSEEKGRSGKNFGFISFGRPEVADGGSWMTIKVGSENVRSAPFVRFGGCK